GHSDLLLARCLALRDKSADTLSCYLQPLRNPLLVALCQCGLFHVCKDVSGNIGGLESLIRLLEVVPLDCMLDERLDQRCSIIENLTETFDSMFNAISVWVLLIRKQNTG